MAGSDQLAEPDAGSAKPAASPDRPRITDRPERGSLADLRFRLERLPPGHPSSPYNDDFTRKPPGFRLKDLELPLHAGAEPAHDIALAQAAASQGNGAARESPAFRDDSAARGGSATREDSAAREGSATREASAAREGSAAREDSAAREGPAAGGAAWANGAAAAPEDAVATREAQPANAARAAAPGPVTRNGISGRNPAADRLTGERWASWAGHDGAAEDSGPARPSRTTNGRADPDTEPHGFRSHTRASAPGRDRSADREGAPGQRNPAVSQAPPGGRPEQPAAAAIRPGPAEPPAPAPDGSWSGSGRYLTPEQCRIADKALTRCRKAEGRSVFGTYGHSGLTAAMRRIEAMLQYGQLLPDTEARALKPPDRFKEKFADLIASHPDKPAETLSHEVHDGVRYAFIVDPEHYADTTLHVHSRLKGQGFELEVRRNCWNNPEYKGINTRWRDPAHDLAFEVQFHTPSSWEARERLDALYRKVIDPSTPPGEREGLRGLRAELASAIAAPRKCMMIRDFRSESQ